MMAGTRLPQDEVEFRVQKCYELRFDTDRPFGVKDWLSIVMRIIAISQNRLTPYTGHRLERNTKKVGESY